MKEYVKIIKALELQHNNPQTKKGIDKTNVLCYYFLADM